MGIREDIEIISNISVVPSILEVVCRTTGMGFAAIARVTDKNWIACAIRDEIQFGLIPGGELVLETTICHDIRQTHQPVIIDHVDEDPEYSKHHTPEMYGFQSYISVPITLKDGSFFGTLCAIDPKPAKLKNAHTLGMFTLFADLIAQHLNAVDQLAISESKLLEERQTAELGEQFIAILGHDLRNPVTAVSNVAQLLLRMPLDERLMRLANILQDSSFRMKGLIENILDFARGRMGDGIILNRNPESPIAEMLRQVLVELQLIWPDRKIETEFNLLEPVNCDAARIAQLFSNILSNALSHGVEDEPIRVNVASIDGVFTLWVANAGKKIPVKVIERLFQPFSRGSIKQNQPGLGLGLYISAEIAKAHGGTLTVKSTHEETRFTLTLPATC